MLGGFLGIALIGFIIVLLVVFFRRFIKNAFLCIIASIIFLLFMGMLSNMAVSLAYYKGGLFRYAPWVVIIVFFRYPYRVFDIYKNKKII